MFTDRHKTKMFTAFRAIAKHTSRQSWSASHPLAQALPSLGGLLLLPPNPSILLSPGLIIFPPPPPPPHCVLPEALLSVLTSRSTSTVCPQYLSLGLALPPLMPSCLHSLHPHQALLFLCFLLPQTFFSGLVISLLLSL